MLLISTGPQQRSVIGSRPSQSGGTWRARPHFGQNIRAPNSSQSQQTLPSLT